MASTSLWTRGSFLRDHGWFDSFFEGKPTDQTGNPLPRDTYAAITFLENRVHKDMNVFEYGSGYSTLWWSRRAAKVVACEHDIAWAERVRRLLPINVNY